MKISAVILTKNEEKNIGRCLESLKWCDEIIVIDDFSKDRTINIAKSRGARIYQRKLGNDFSQQRNFGLKKAKNNWVLFIDADEVVPHSLATEIVRRLKKEQDRIKGFYLRRQDFFLGQPLKYGESAKIKLLRLGKKNAGRWQGKVHEKWEIIGKKATLENSLFHYSHPNLTKCLEKINFYSSLRAQELKNQGKRSNWIKIIIFPLAKFFKDYFFLQGFKDGIAGFIFAGLMSFHSFLVRSKLFTLKSNE